MKTKDCTAPVNKKNSVFTNRFGEIKAGTRVSFHVENEDQWAGDLVGVLISERGKFKIQTKRSGVLTIDKGSDVYGNTIEPV